jgi:hypothetical protein
MGRQAITFPRWSFYVLLLITYSLFVGGAILLVSPGSLSLVEFLKSFAKLNYYGLGAVIIGAVIHRIDQSALRMTIMWILLVHGLIAIYIYAVQVSGAPLPYTFFWTGQDSPLAASYFRGDVFIRARGLFSEPSFLGIFQTVGLSLLLLDGHVWQRKMWILLVIIVSILLTFSFSSAALLLVVLILLRSNTHRTVAKLTPRRIVRFAFQGVILVSLVVGILSTSVTRQTVETAIFARARDLLSGEDVSGMGRLVGSYETVNMMLRESPIIGTGLGGLGASLESNAGSLNLAQMLILQDAEAWNMLVYVFSSLGILGLLILVMMLFLLWQNSTAAWVLLASMFASGAFLGPLFWIHVSLVGCSTLTTRNREQYPAKSAEY